MEHAYNYIAQVSPESAHTWAAGLMEAISSLTVRVPHPLYSRLEERAKQAQHSVEEEVVGTLP